MASNSAFAKSCLALTLGLFVYYFLWVAVVPFLLVDEGKLAFPPLFTFSLQPPYLLGNWIFSLFPPLSYAFIFPVTSGTVFISSLGGYTVYQVRSYLKQRCQ